MATAPNNNKANETSPDIVKLRACDELFRLKVKIKIRASER